MTPTVGGLFSGIGGLELGFVRNGYRVAWLCESDPAARRVLAERFPGVPIHPDVTTFDPADVEPVDVLTGGTPCQGFSIAGGRTGLDHTESSLFSDYVRILDGLPTLRWAVWENVPGILSHTNPDGGRTWPHVVAALVGTDHPVRLRSDVRWNTGLAARGRRAVSWRVVDSRHFGVPQRRRRVYACVAVGDPGTVGRRAFGALLAKPDGGRGCAQTVRPSREGPAGVADRGAVMAVIQPRMTSRTGGSGAGTPGTGVSVGDGPAPTVIADGPDAVVIRQREGKPGGGKGPLLAFGESLTLATTNDQVVLAWDGAQITSPVDRAAVAPGRPAPMILAGSDLHTAIRRDSRWEVRRLTPTEQERLQGFPDGWTEPAGSDTARYRALGNAVTVPVVAWIARRITAADTEWTP